MLKEYVYTKILYNDNKALINLRQLLKVKFFKGKFIKKKDLKLLGIISSNRIFIIYSKDNFKDITILLNILKLSFEFLQILGIVKGNILVPLDSKIIFYINKFYNNTFFIKLFIIFIVKLIILKKLY